MRCPEIHPIIPATARALRARSLPFCLAAVLMLIAAGCATGPRGVHGIPISRDYQDLARVELAEAEASVRAARRAGSAGFAPHDYAAAENYLAMAHAAERNRDRLGAWDFAALAVQHADRAIEASPSVSRPNPDDMPPNEEAAARELERLASDWQGLDKDRAVFALPFLFADITSTLSGIEYDLNRGAWQEAARAIPEVRIMLDTLRERDIDGDGIPDIDDPDPWRPEEVPEPPAPPPALRPISFGSGSVSVDAEGKGYLDGVVDFLAYHPEWTLHVKGHTDNRHSETYNLDLSRRRAEAVHRYLVGAGVPPNRLSVSYYGSANPVEETPPGVASATNRRVELLLEHDGIPIE